MLRICLITLVFAMAVFAQEPPDYYCLPNDPAIKYACGTQQDSVEAYYKKRAERSLQLGHRHKSMSTKFLIVGGIGLAASTSLLIYSLHESDKYEKEQTSNDSIVNEPPIDGNPIPFLIISGLGVSIGCIIAGAIFRHTGNNKLRKAEFYKKQLQDYQKNGKSVSLEILPIFNPIRQAYGGNLLLDF